MRLLLRSIDLMPAIFLGAISLFMFSRYAVSHYPTSESAWAVFISLSSFGRELTRPIEFMSDTAFLGTGLFLALFSSLLVVATRSVNVSRIRVLAAHATILMFILALQDERVFAASIAGVTTDSTPYFNISLANLTWPMMIIGSGLVLACLRLHKSLILAIRHPVRTVDPLTAV